MSQNLNNEKIQQCILNIDMVARHLFFSVEGMKELKVPLQSQVFTDVIQYSYIRICTILDEVTILNGLAKGDIFLQDTLYCMKPALKGINEYKGLRKARNLLLAHYNRDQKNVFTPWWTELADFKLPRTYKELNQILGLILLINTILVTRYNTEFHNFSDRQHPDFEKYFDEVEKLESDATTTPSPLDEIQDEVQRRCIEKGIVDIIIDPAMIEYFKDGIAKKFKPRPVDEIHKMTDEELRNQPEFRLAFASLVARENKRRDRPLNSKELECLETVIIGLFRNSVLAND
ncbi:hypothetical protein [Parachryseolinea silvisoli]|uniref:hypothetical protein n=1 Tax=Parachryseolinea silvisoli TaxID=2873601 RepID=UPI002265EA9B|nr:hypothetical protein [Parachryseolinea silvisoli]MCD9019143.1 hypothetical protein [Parachryseolinea silvisoli]